MCVVVGSVRVPRCGIHARAWGGAKGAEIQVVCKRGRHHEGVVMWVKHGVGCYAGCVYSEVGIIRAPPPHCHTRSSLPHPHSLGRFACCEPHRDTCYNTPFGPSNTRQWPSSPPPPVVHTTLPPVHPILPLTPPPPSVSYPLPLHHVSHLDAIMKPAPDPLQ